MVLAAKNAKSAKKAWPMVRLGDVCEEMRERIPSSNVSLECYITTDNMVKGCGGVRIADNVPEAVGLVRYQKGDVLLSNIRPYLKKSWLADRDGGCSSDVIVFRSLHSDLSPEYLFRVLSQDGFFDYSMQNVSGTKMPRGKRDWIKAFQFPLPPLPIQREIVARLEKELGEADKLAAKFKRVAELADDAFKAELDETFKAVEEAKIRLGDVCELKGGFAFKSSDYSSSGLQVVRIGDLAEDGISATEAVYYPEKKELARYSFSEDCILICLTGSIGKMTFVKDGVRRYLNQRVGLLTVKDRALLDYLWYYLHTDTVILRWHIAKTSVNGNLRNSDIADLSIPLPAFSTQRAIVAKLDAAKERCEKLKAAAMCGLAAAENLRKAILAEAFEQ